MNSPLPRRDFLLAGGLLPVALGGLAKHSLGNPLGLSMKPEGGYGRLVADPMGQLDLPKGFEYSIISRVGDEMSDGLLVPGACDGMAAFAAENGKTVLIRNHENEHDLVKYKGAFGASNERLASFGAGKVYDNGRGTNPSLGGTTTLVLDGDTGAVEEQFLSLAGTHRNCSGGPTPWGSWLTCEESVVRSGKVHERDHGYVFEVPSSAREAVDPVPLEGLGRFLHEAAVVDPVSGCVYLTEDRTDGLLYRFTPIEPGNLAAGGKLEALVVREAPSLDTRNWYRYPNVESGVALDVDWITMRDPSSPEDDMRFKGYLSGAARFARGEGMVYADGAIWFACTTGGGAKAGQIWRYVPSPKEGRGLERKEPGKLDLFFESPHRRLVDMCDNITMAPWGDLILCEDGVDKQNSLVGLTPDGDVYPLARNAGAPSEFAGACFAPDGKTLFVNIQWSGLTVAIRGPWSS